MSDSTEDMLEAEEAAFKEGVLTGKSLMRERVAKLAQDYAEFCTEEAHKGGDWKYLKDRANCAAFIAKRLRALPVE